METSRSADAVATVRALSAELDRLDETAARIYRLNRTDMRALEVIGRDGPIAPTELARRVGLTTGGITTVIDRLERAGYVARRPEGTDRRRLVVETTEATRRLDREVFSGLGRRVKALTASYDHRDLDVIHDYLEQVRAIVSQYAESLATSELATPASREPTE